MAGFLTYRQLAAPHDCYDCFNRVPQISYSNFQYTEQQHKQLKLERFLGKGVEKYEQQLMKELLKEQLDESQRLSEVHEALDTVVLNESGIVETEVNEMYKSHNKMMKSYLNVLDQTN
jgi:hypothetical protein